MRIQERAAAPSFQLIFLPSLESLPSYDAGSSKIRTSVLQTRRNLRFESEPFRLDLNRIEERRAEDLVESFHIGKAQTGEHVGEGREELIPHIVP